MGDPNGDSRTVLTAAWQPRRSQPPFARRSLPHYSTRERGRKRPHGHRELPAVEAAFPRESWAPDQQASLHDLQTARGLKLRDLPDQDLSAPASARLRDHEQRPGRPRHAGSETARQSSRLARDKELAQQPCLRPRLRVAGGRVWFGPSWSDLAGWGGRRIGIVMPTLTWQAYNLGERRQ